MVSTFDRVLLAVSAVIFVGFFALMLWLTF